MPPADALLQHLAVTCAEIRRGFDRHAGMTQARRQLLVLLAARGETSHAELGRELGADGATITRLVKRLESEGVARRRLDPEDNRFTLASLTPAGERVVEELRGAHRAVADRLLAGVDPDERETVLRVLERLRANARALGHPGGAAR